MNLEPFSRRSFLRYSATTAAITTALAAGGWSFFTGKEVKKFKTQFGTLLVMDATQANTFYAFIMYYGHESKWQAIGYDGPFGKVPEQLGEQRLHYPKQSQAVTHLPNAIKQGAKVYAHKVVVAAGAFNTPFFLMQQGLKEQLRELGKNLSTNPSSMVHDIL
jgi:hypothetical protein